MAARRWSRLTVVGLVASLLVGSSGCDVRTAGPGDPAQDPWQGPALEYGLAPHPHPEVTFRPDVVLVEGGAGAVRSVTADGFSWRIDALTPGAEQLTPGAVMFLTGRAVGRVLATERTGDDLLVTIGPVDLTEVIEEGTFEVENLVLDEPVIRAAGDAFWADPDALEAELADGGGGELLARPIAGPPITGPPIAGPPALAAVSQPPRPSAPPARRGAGTDTRAGKHSVFAICCSDGVGARFSYQGGGLKAFGTATLTFQRPDARFHLAIRGGSVTRAELTISGGFGIKVDFEAGTDGAAYHRTLVFPIAAEFEFPIAQVLGVPITFSITQSLRVRTAFGTTLGTMAGKGEYSLGSTLGFGYANGRFGPRVAESFKRRSSLLNSLTGVPVGVMGLVIEHRVRFTVGFNAHLLKAGVYFELRTSYGATMGSSLGAVGTLGSHFVECRGVGLGVWAQYGVGYTLLEVVTRLINRFLSLLRVGPIAISGGIHARPSRIYANEEVVPDVDLCRTAPGLRS